MTYLLLPDLVQYTHILKTERLNQDFPAVLRAINPELSAQGLLGKHRYNESLPSDWRQHYTQEIADRVFLAYEEDFRRFGYERESWVCSEQLNSPREMTDTLGRMEQAALEAIRVRNEMIHALNEVIHPSDSPAEKSTDPVGANLHSIGVSSLLPALHGFRGWLSEAEALHLFDLASSCAGAAIVEVGSYHGRSTYALAMGSQSGGKMKVYAVDPHEVFLGPLGGTFGPEDRKAFMQNLISTTAYQTVRLINLSSEVVTAGWIEPVGLLFIDGDHTYEGVLRDWKCWSPHLTADATVVFDDAIDVQLGPSRLIEEICSSDNEWRISHKVGKFITLKRSSNPIA